MLSGLLVHVFSVVDPVLSWSATLWRIRIGIQSVPIRICISKVYISTKCEEKLYYFPENFKYAENYIYDTADKIKTMPTGIAMNKSKKIIFSDLYLYLRITWG